MFEAYSVAVRVSLINGVTSGLMNISRAFAKAHGDAKGLQRELDAIKFKLVAGAALAGTGLFGLELLGKTLPYAREYTHQLEQMNIAGMKQAEIARSIQAAWGASKVVPTSTAAENLAAIRELRMVFGNTNDAIANMPAVQQLQAILSNVKGVSSGHDEAYTVAKALEMKGAVRNPGEFRTEADMMAKAIVASGGKVGAQDFLSTFKYGRSATIGWNEHFAFQILPTLIQEMKNGGGSGGSGGPGNALMSVYDKVINGKIAQKDIPLWEQLGLIDSSKVVRTKTGSTKGLLPGAVSGWAAFQQDPFSWTQNVLMPALKAHGITDPGQQQMYLSRLGGTRTAAFMLQQMGTQGWKFSRDVPLIQGAKGLGAYHELLKNDPMMAHLALQKQWQNLLAVVGYQIMPTLVSGTLKLVTGLRDLTAAMRAHPALTKALVVGFAALSAAMLFGGTVILLSAAFDAIGVALKVMQVAKLFQLAKGLTGIDAAAPMAQAAVVALGGGLVGLAALITNVIAPALAVIGVGISVKKGLDYQNVLKNPKAASAADLASAIQYAQANLGDYKSQIANKHILPATGQRFVQKWRGDLGALQSEQSARSGSPFVAAPSMQAKPTVAPVYLNKDIVGKIMSEHFANEFDRSARAGASSFDPGMALAPVGLNY